ncbi:MAG: phosphoribosylglycinamide formyltransferase [Saprospiraceae bacterium]
MKRIAIFASGSGSNALKIIEHFENNANIEVALIVTNKRKAGVLAHANFFNIAQLIINKSYFRRECILNVLKKEKIDLIVLAGFLLLVPKYLITAFPNRIVNIHPSLLPKYGGKGMYGHHVHEAVKSNSEKESGLTIHYVNEEFDKGSHIFQAKIDILPIDNPTDIAKKVLKLEHKHYAKVIEKVLIEL